MSADQATVQQQAVAIMRRRWQLDEVASQEAFTEIARELGVDPARLAAFVVESA